MVFVRVLKVDYGVPYSGVYLLLGLVIWSFFSELTGGSVGAIVGKGDLLRKLNFPRYVIVLATSFSALINFILNLVIVAIFMIISGVDMQWHVLLLPLLFIELFVFGVALGFFLSATYVKLRDIGYVWDVVMQALFYLTPIFFPLTLAPLWAQKILILSPLAQAMQDIRYVVVSSNTTTINDVYGNGWMRLVPIAITIVAVCVAALYFRRRSRFFAEEI